MMPPASKVVLEARGLTRHYPIRQGLFRPSAALRAVDGISLLLQAGETLAVVGESGSGKSTLGRVVTLIEPPTAGTLRLDGQDPATADAAQRRNLRRTVQMVFQDPYGSLNPRRKVGAIVEEPLIINTDLTSEARQQRVAEMLAAVGLRPEHAERYPHMFSGGQRQRIAIARALVLNPRLVVADEPVSALDISIQAQVLNLMMDLQERFNLAYLFISHDPKARSPRWSASTAPASRPCSRRSWASCRPRRRRRSTVLGQAGASGAEEEPASPMCRRAEDSRLELPGAGRGRRHDGPLRPHEHHAHPDAAAIATRSPQRSTRVGMSDYPQAPDRRALRRPEEARLPRPRAGPGRPGHPARRTLHRRRRQDRGRHRRAAAVAPRRRAACMLVSTHNLGSVPEFCDRTVLVKRTVLAYGPHARTPSPRPISSAPSAACSGISCSAAPDLHDDDDPRRCRCSPTTSGRWSSTARRRNEAERSTTRPRRCRPCCSSPSPTGYMRQRHVGVGAGRRGLRLPLLPT